MISQQLLFPEIDSFSTASVCVSHPNLNAALSNILPQESPLMFA